MTKYMMNGKMKKSEKETSDKTGKARLTWIMYLYSLRLFLAYLENWFESLGNFITRHPKKTILIALMAVALSAFGIYRLHVEKRTEKLFVPQNSLAEQALKKGKPYFRNFLNTRSEEIIFTSKDKTNILTPESLAEISTVIQSIKRISDHQKLCKELPEFLADDKKLMFDASEICRQLNIMEIFDGRNYSKETIFNTFHTAVHDSNLLMSNGRTAFVNLQDSAEKLKFEGNMTVSAKSLRIVLFLKRNEEKDKAARIMNWEKNFTKQLEDFNLKLKHVKLLFSSERSMEDAISDSSTSDIGLISITFTVMSTFACLTLAKFVNPIRGHNWLALSGIISTALGILSGIGLTMLLGLPFISLVGVVPFLVVSIGIDDMFIIVDEFDRQSKQYEPKRRVAYSLSKVGATIAMTTITDIIAFLVSATSEFPAVRYFCIYTAICITLEFLLQITLFVAFLTFDAMRIKSNRCDAFPLRIVADRNSCAVTDEISLVARFLNKFGRILLKPPIKVFVIVLTLGMCAFGVIGCMNIDTQFNRQSLALKGSHFAEYVNYYESSYPQNIPVSIQVTDNVNYSDPAVREKIKQTVSIAHKTGFYELRNFSWIHSFDHFTSKNNIKTDGQYFQAALEQFLNSTNYRQHNLDIIRDNNGKILASRLIVFYKHSTKSEFQKDAMIKLRYAIAKHDARLTIAADPFIYFEQYAIVTKEVVTNLVMVSVIIVFVLIPFCIHPLIIFFILIGFASLVVELFGLMYLWDVQLNSISMINMVMSIGFSVDYSTHIAHAFVTSKQESVNDRIIEALSTVGGSVLLGGISTFLGMSLTGLASSPIFQIFFKMFVGIILFGLYNGIVLLPVLLSIFARFVDIRAKHTFTPEDFKTFPLSFMTWSSKKTKKKVSPEKKGSVAVMGLSTRLPTVRTKDDFWALLKEGRNTVSEYPEDRYSRKEHFDGQFHPHRTVAGKIYVSRGSYLEGIAGFDYTFFGITPAEARMMDPQQRMLLQGAYEAIEDAGMTLDEVQQCSTGVYVGIMNQDYNSVTLGKDSLPHMNQFTATGNAYSMAANRISFSLNLSGPSMAVDTACSSSLTALNIACDHVQKGIVDVAIVGAANLILCPNTQAPICQANMLAADGKCKVFDEAADGYGRGEGVVVFVIKSSEFVHETDQPYCDIISWSINNDGKSAAPITAPSAESQKKLMRDVLQEACVDPRDVQYVEMHGTGTIIGDMVEVASVGGVYGTPRGPEDPVLVGSIKSNINHTESTAGLAGLAKVCLMMEHGVLVPTISVETPAARLGIEQNRLHVQTECSEWPKNKQGMPRLAAINSFGFGGSNAHVIVKEVPSTNRKQEDDNTPESANMMMVLSASSGDALGAMAKSFSTWLESTEDTKQNRVDICYTLSERKTAHNMRLVVDASSLKTASQTLAEFAKDPKKDISGLCTGKASKFSSQLAFVFGGQGSQWLGMAGDILKNESILQTLRSIDKLAKSIGHNQSLVAYLSTEEGTKLSIQPSIATLQLSIFSLQYAVAKYLIDTAGIVPMFVCGHSLGDITAACVASIISLKSAVKIIKSRAFLQNCSRSNGAMIAIGLEGLAVEKIFEKLEIKDQVCIAAENDSKSVTVSGDEEAINKLENYLKEEMKNIFVRKLDTPKAFHSHHMEPMKAKFMKKVDDANITVKSAEIRFFSTTEGRELNGNEIDSSYWWRNVRYQVLFRQAAEKMIENGARTLIEISPRPVLSHYLSEVAKQMEVRDVTVLQAMPRRKESQRLKYLHVNCIGKMYSLGYSVNFGLLQSQENAKFIRMPTYPWQETELWTNDEYHDDEKTTLLLGTPVSIDADQIRWDNEIGLHNFEFLRDHVMKSLGVIFPGAGYIEMAFDAVLMDTKIEPIIIKDAVFHNTLQLNDDSVRNIKSVRQKSTTDGLAKFAVNLVADDGEMVLCTAKLKKFKTTAETEALSLASAFEPRKTAENIADRNQIETSTGTFIAESSMKDTFIMAQDERMLQATPLTKGDRLEDGAYEEFTAQRTFLFGEKFSLIDCSWTDGRNALARLKLPPWLQDELHQYVIHPSIIDACLQTRAVIEVKKTEAARRIIPTGADEITLNPIKQSFQSLYCYATIRNNPETSEVKMMDENRNVIMHIKGINVKEFSEFERRITFEDSIYEVKWSNQENSANLDRLSDDQVFIIIGEASNQWMATTVHALTDMNVNSHNILTLKYDKKIELNDFMAECLSFIENVSNNGKKMVIINLLPIMSCDIPLVPNLSNKAESYCFESTLSIIQFIDKKDIKETLVVAFTSKHSSCKSLVHGTGMVHDKETVQPWGALTWGMAKVTNLESKTPVVCVDFPEKLTPDVCRNALLSIYGESAENGFVATSNHILQPSLERIKLTQSDGMGKKSSTDKEEFYLSWSDDQNTFFAKKSTNSYLLLPEHHMEIKVSHISSVMGQCETVLEKVKSYNSQALIQTVAGEVTEVGKNVNGFQVGDQVVAFVQNRFLKSKVQVPEQSVIKIPTQNSSETAVVLSGCILLSRYILKKIHSIRPSIKSMLIVSTHSNQGICSVTAAIAQSIGISVTSIDGDMPSKFQTDENVPSLSNFLGKSDGGETKKSEFDCIVCSNDLHSTDNLVFNEILAEDGILAVFDTEGKLPLSEYSFRKSVTIINVNPGHLSFRDGITAESKEDFEHYLISLSLPQSDVDVIKISKVLASGFQCNEHRSKNCFSCFSIDFGSKKKIEIRPPSMDYQGLKEDRTYIVVGGTKGLGLNTVEWMASRGAGTIVTLSRSDVPSGTRENFKNLELKFGAKIVPLKLDISSKEGSKHLELKLNSLPSIAGIVNSAGVLDDKSFLDIDRKSYRDVMASKVDGTLLLHEMLERRNEQLDFFVLYSSITSVIGNQGQTSYAAANSFLNSFAEYRMTSLNKPCLSICWGAMGGAGMLKRNTDVAALLQQIGLHLLNIQKGLKWMETVLTTMPSQVNICICDIDWMSYFKSCAPKVANSVLLKSLRKGLKAENQTEEGELLNKILNAKSVEKQQEITSAFIIQWLAKWIGGNQEEVDCNVPFFTYGIDSIGASIFKLYIFQNLNIEFEVFYFMLPETTASSLSFTLVDAINQKFKSPQKDTSGEIAMTDFEIIEDNNAVEFRRRQSSRRGPFRSFRAIAPEPEEEKPLVLPNDYLSSIYDPPDAKTKLFIVHPSHRYAGIFQGMAAGMKFQELFSVYAFGSPDPGYIGEDIGSVRRLAKACTEMMLKLQPHGPYFLAGYSFGGLVATEMAAILKESGKETAQLIMIDTLSWLPEAKSNQSFFMENFGSSATRDSILNEQVREFLCRIATTQLSMTRREFDEMADEMIIDDVARVLNENAQRLELNLPDMQQILQSTFDDQKMATRHHMEWIPPMNIYDGPVIYIKAESCLCNQSTESGGPSSCFCKVAIASADNCWSSIFQKKVITIACPGNHYSMMDQGRAQNVGKVLAVAATLRYRDIFPMVGRIALNSNHTTTAAIFKERGMKVFFIQKSAFKNVSSPAVLKINKSYDKFKIIMSSSRNTVSKIQLKDIVNIRMQDRSALASSNSLRRSDELDVNSGYCFLKKDLREFIIMCYSRQDFQRFTFLLEAAYRLKLPL